MNDLVARLEGLLAGLHAPLPWKAVPWHVEEGSSAVRCAEDWLVASTSSDEHSALIAEAITALPALLAAVREGEAEIERLSAGLEDARYALQNAWERDGDPDALAAACIADIALRPESDTYNAPSPTPHTRPDDKSTEGNHGSE